MPKVVWLPFQNWYQSLPAERFKKAPRIARYDIEKFDDKGDFILWKAKIKAIVDQPKTLKTLIMFLGKSLVKKQLMECGQNWMKYISPKIYLTLHT